MQNNNNNNKKYRNHNKMYSNKIKKIFMQKIWNTCIFKDQHTSIGNNTLYDNLSICLYQDSLNSPKNKGLQHVYAPSTCNETKIKIPIVYIGDRGKS